MITAYTGKPFFGSAAANETEAQEKFKQVMLDVRQVQRDSRKTVADIALLIKDRAPSKVVGKEKGQSLTQEERVEKLKTIATSIAEIKNNLADNLAVLKLGRFASAMERMLKGQQNDTFFSRFDRQCASIQRLLNDITDSATFSLKITAADLEKASSEQLEHMKVDIQNAGTAASEIAAIAEEAANPVPL